MFKVHRRLLKKEDIGKPTDFRHISHNGQILINDNTSTNSKPAQPQQHDVTDETAHPLHPPATHKLEPGSKKGPAPLPPIPNQTSTVQPANHTPAAQHTPHLASREVTVIQTPKMTPSRKAPPPPRPSPPKLADTNVTSNTNQNSTKTVSNALQIIAVTSLTFIKNFPNDEVETNNETSNEQQEATSPSNDVDNTSADNVEALYECIEDDRSKTTNGECEDGKTEIESNNSQDITSTTREGLDILQELDAFLVKCSMGDDQDDDGIYESIPPQYSSLHEPQEATAGEPLVVVVEAVDVDVKQDRVTEEVVSTNTQETPRAECATDLAPTIVLPRPAPRTNPGSVSPDSPEMNETVPTVINETSSDTGIATSNIIVCQLQTTTHESSDVSKDTAPVDVTECCQRVNGESVNITTNNPNISIDPTVKIIDENLETSVLNVNKIMSESPQSDVGKEHKVTLATEEVDTCSGDTRISITKDPSTLCFTKSNADDSLAGEVKATVTEEVNTSVSIEIIAMADVVAPRLSVLNWNPDTCYRLEDIEDQELKKLLEKAGVSNQELEDSGTRHFIYEFIQQHGGKKAVKEEVLLLTDVPASPSRHLHKKKRHKLDAVDNGTVDHDDDNMSTYL